jgi:hypothetical protein
MRNCTRDEGGPFGLGNQVLISSHRKLLRLTAVVVNVAETSGQPNRDMNSRRLMAFPEAQDLPTATCNDASTAGISGQ